MSKQGTGASELPNSTKSGHVTGRPVTRLEQKKTLLTCRFRPLLLRASTRSVPVLQRDAGPLKNGHGFPQKGVRPIVKCAIMPWRAEWIGSIDNLTDPPPAQD